MMKLSNLKHQRGAILAFSLVMLLLLTLAGTRMIQQNKQQFQIAGNARLVTQEFANAEAVLANAKYSINKNTAHIDVSGTSITSKSHACEPTTAAKQNILLPKPISSNTVTILSTACIAASGVITKCVDYSSSSEKSTCYPKNASAAGVDCTNLNLDGVAGLFNKSCPSYDSTTNKFSCGVDDSVDPSIPLDCTNANSVERAKICDTPSKKYSVYYDYDVCYQTYDPQCDYETDDFPTCTAFPPRCPTEVYTIDAVSTNTNGTSQEIISDHVVYCGGG